MMLPKITLPGRLSHLVKYCEMNCVAGCCGIDAFDFSPLHVASCASAFTGRISVSDIAEWEQQLTKAEELIKALTPDQDGYVCSIAEMNQCFTRESFASFIAELRHSIQVAPKILELSAQLRQSTR